MMSVLSECQQFLVDSLYQGSGNCGDHGASQDEGHTSFGRGEALDLRLREMKLEILL